MSTPKRLLSRLAAFDRAEGLTSPGDGVLAAVSGGPDSAALLHHLARLSRTKRLRLAALHLHHGLRGEDADRDAVFARRLAGRLGVPFRLRRLPVASFARRERRSLEDAARVLRYRALASEARRLRMRKAAVGHQLDDHAETVLLHLLRGTKAKGLAGIPPKRPLSPSVRLIRPLLALTRKEVLQYLRSYGLGYRTDRSNREDRFTRNWVRRKLLPLMERRNPSIRRQLSAISRDVRRLLA